MNLKMKKITLFLSGIILVAALNAQTSTTTTAGMATTTAAKPQVDITKVLEFKEANHDFGKIPYGKPVEFDVLIKNISSDSVKIDNVKVGCGCTTPRYQPGPYASGQDFKVTLGFSGYAEGHFEKYVDI